MRYIHPQHVLHTTATQHSYDPAVESMCTNNVLIQLCAQVRRKGRRKARHRRRHVNHHQQGQGDRRGERHVRQDHPAAGQDGGGRAALPGGRYHYLRVDGLLPAVREHVGHRAVGTRPLPAQRRPGSHLPGQSHHLHGRDRGRRVQG